jgi:hypothetical protein
LAKIVLFDEARLRSGHESVEDRAPPLAKEPVMSEEPQLTESEQLPEFIEATATDVAGQPDVLADQTPYADEEEGE